jgi:hypothetical protein
MSIDAAAMRKLPFVERHQTPWWGCQKAVTSLFAESTTTYYRPHPMEKQDAVASLGQTPLLQPARVRAALKANDRLKLYLSVLQAAAAHAAAPERAPLDLSREIAAADIAPREQAVWLRDLPAGASMQGDELQLPELPRLVARLRDDLAVMARPVLDDVDTALALGKRVAPIGRPGSLRSTPARSPLRR